MATDIYSRRRFLHAFQQRALFAAAAGLPCSALGLTEPSEEEAFDFVESQIGRIKSSEAVSRLHRDTIEAEVPLQYPIAKDIVLRDFSLRLHLAYVLSELSESQIESIIKETPSKYSLGVQIPDDALMVLLDSYKEYHVSVAPKLGEIVPIELTAMPSGEGLGDKKCGLVILELFLGALVGLIDKREALEALFNYFEEPIRCAERAVKVRDFQALDQCVAEFLKRLINAAGLDLIRRELGEEAVKKLLRVLSTRLILLTGLVFLLIQFILLIKDNWGRLEQTCQIEALRDQA